jgi:glycosyltransferase involved in cell wall biosynthesis
MLKNTFTSSAGLSVAMCTYNGEKYIGEQLDSIINQTIKVNEIIICDDCSSDGTLGILNDYQESYPDLIKVIINEKNMGYVKNFEKSISNCTGELIFLSDQDDVWMPDKVEKISNKFHSDSSITCIFTDAKVVGKNLVESKGELWDQVGFTKEQRKEFTNEGALIQLIKRNVATGATMAFKCSMIKNIIPIPEKIVHDAWIAFICSLHGKTQVVDEPLILYRQHEGQQIGSSTDIFFKIKKAKAEKGISILWNYESSKHVLEKLIKYKKEYGLNDDLIYLAKDRVDFFRARLGNKKKSFISKLYFDLNPKNINRYSTYVFGFQSIVKDLFF